jgi:hypothetical protein
MPVPGTVRALVLARAAGRCEYCRTRGWLLTLDHVVPRAVWKSAARSGQPAPPCHPDDPTNLVAACFACNLAKWKATTGHDPLTGRIERLFNPRQDTWEDHFAWADDDGIELVGTTPIGRATITRLRLNRDIYREQRKLLRAAMLGGGPPWP